MFVTRSRHIFRAAVSILAIVAWFGITNHCALATALRLPMQMQSSSQAAEEGAGCSKCDHSKKEKKQNNGKPACCKDFAKANLAKNETLKPRVLSGLLLPPLAVAIAAVEIRLPVNASYTDTGPPRSFSFAEIVLQRCIFSNAPPALS